MAKLIFATLTLLAALCTGIVHSQTRGIKPADDPQAFSGSTKLVVVGVSQYQNIQSLSYAHTDALAFYNFMTSPAGGKIDTSNARVLLNEKATAANIWATVYWLLETTKEGETVIFYFAGHGDLERKTITQPGFLLASDAPKVMYPVGGTLPVNMLQEFISTLVQTNKARVIMISDACHSGKLAGGLEGVSNTATALQAQWDNTIKILSSQPGELSQEGAKWNGGGGVFTYFLVKGLMGFADRNHDNKVTVQEINIYLMDNVSKETNYSQNPSFSGNQTAVLAYVDTVALAKAKTSENNLTFNNKIIAQRGFEDEYKKSLDSATFKEYTKFRYCIENHFLIDTNPKYGCAWAIYQNLKNDKKASSVSNNMKYSLLAALQQNYQQFMNNVINNGSFIELQNQMDNTMNITIGELKKALEIIDTTYLLYNHVKASYLGIQSLSDFYFRDNMQNFQISNIDKAIELEPDNAIFYIIKGVVLSQGMKKSSEAIIVYEKALELSPNCNLVTCLLGMAYENINDYNNAIKCYERAIKNDPSQLLAYQGLADVYGGGLKQKEKCIYYLSKLDSNATQNKMPNFLATIASRYMEYYNDTAKVIFYMEKIYAIDSSIYELSYGLGDFYFMTKQTKKAEASFQKCIILLNNLVKENPDNRVNYFYLTCCYSMMNNKEHATKNLELWFPLKMLSLEKEGVNLKDARKAVSEMLKNEKAFNNIRESKEFKALIKKYLK